MEWLPEPVERRWMAVLLANVKDPRDGCNRPGAWPTKKELIDMGNPTCAWPDCASTTLIARGLCERDYRRASRGGVLQDFSAAPRECYVCGEMFEITKHRKTCCSPECTRASNGKRLVDARLMALPDRDCEFCQAPIPVTVRQGAAYCSATCQQANWYHLHETELRQRSRQWAAEHDGVRRAQRHTRRARMYAVEYETFDIWEIAERDDWMCSICGEPVDRRLKYPNPRSKSLDHVIPLAKGGSHTRANAAVAHLLCNTKKRDRVSARKGVTNPSAVAS